MTVSDDISQLFIIVDNLNKRMKRIEEKLFKCPFCDGEGEVYDNYADENYLCDNCNGEGVFFK